MKKIYSVIGLLILLSPVWASPPKEVLEGFQAFHLHQWSRALQLAQSVHRADPENIDAYWLEALCHLHDRNDRLARQTAQAAVKVAHSSQERAYANYLLAESWLRENAAEADRLIAQKVVPASLAGHTHACTSAAWYYVKRGDGARALSLVDKALPFLSPEERPAVYDTRGAALILLGRYKEAWTDLEKALESYRSPNLLFHRGQCLEGLKQPKQALILYRQSLNERGWLEFEADALKRVKALETSYPSADPRQ